MAHAPGSIGRTLKGELFVVDSTGVPHIDGSIEFCHLWLKFVMEKREVLIRLYDMLSDNYWDAATQQILIDRPRLVGDRELCGLMCKKIFESASNESSNVITIRNYISTWVPHVEVLYPNETWLAALIAFNKGLN